MLPIRNYFIDSYLMDVVLDGSSDEDHYTLSEHSDEMSDASEDTVSFKIIGFLIIYPINIIQYCFSIKKFVYGLCLFVNCSFTLLKCKKYI